MKEDWINKLIKLLDDYKKGKNIFNNDMDWQLEIGRYIYVNYPCAERLCSKQFWFIQRLVKHFKLDMAKIDARIALSDFNATDRVIMALAISEDHITLLIDCLK